MSERMMDHEYDGIREYDNPTPGWWHALFLSSVVFAAVYAVYWHGNPDAASIERTWERAQVADFKRIFGSVGELKPDLETVMRMRDDPKLMEVARSIFVGQCAACHGANGAGIGGSACPNLTDDHWKSVKRIDDLFTVISKGAGSGAMPAWENRLSQNERIILAAFVANLREKPVAGRAEEGEVIAPWPARAGK